MSLRGMAELRRRFGIRVQQLLEVEARKAIGVDERFVTSAGDAVAPLIAPKPPRINLNGPSRTFEEEMAARSFDEDLDRDPWDDDRFDPVDTIDDDEPRPVFFRIGYARRPGAH